MGTGGYYYIGFSREYIGGMQGLHASDLGSDKELGVHIVICVRL